MMHDALVLILGPILLLVVVALLGAWLYEQRTKQLRRMAEEMGFDFKDRDPLLAAEVFGPRKGLNVLNVLRGKAEGLEVTLFDLHAALPSTTNVVHIRFTMLLFRDAEANWPSFCLRPTFYRSPLVGYQQGGIRLFAKEPGFGRACILEGESEEAVGAIFTEPVRRFLAGVRGLWLEAGGPWLFYSRGRLLAARDVQAFLGEAFRVLKVLETGDVEQLT